MSEADDEVSSEWSSCGLVDAVYCPGSRRALLAIPEAEIRAPTGLSVKNRERTTTRVVAYWLCSKNPQGIDQQRK